MKLVFPTLAFAISALVLGGCGLTTSSQKAEPEGPLQVADVAMASGAPELALHLADMELEQKPGSIAALHTRADALYAMSALNEAEAVYRTLLKTNPDDTAARIGLGRTLLRSDPAAAEAAFLTVLASQRDSQPALNDLGIARDLQGRHQDAQTAYRQALAIAPDNTDVRTNLEMSLGLSRDGQEAIPVKQAAAVPVIPDEPQGPVVIKVNTNVAADGHASRARLTAALPAIIHPPESPITADPDLQAAVAHIELPAADPMPPQSSTGQQPEPTEPLADANRPQVALPMGPPASAPQRTEPPIEATDATPADAPEQPGFADDAPPSTPGAPAQANEVTAAQPSPPQPSPTQPSPTQPSSQATTGEYYVQIGALDSAERAQAEWQRFRLRLPDLFANLTPAVHPAAVNNRTFWRLRTGTFSSYGSASAFCARLRLAGANCWTPATHG